MTSSEGMQHVCEFCGHDFAKDPQSTHHCDPGAVRGLERKRCERVVQAARMKGDVDLRSIVHQIHHGEEPGTT
jgi:hypothetical protein